MDTEIAPVEQEKSEETAYAQARRLFGGSSRPRVFDLLLRPLSEKEMAAELGVSKNTIHGHIKTIYAVLKVHSRKEFRDLILGPQEQSPVHRSVQMRELSDVDREAPSE